ncbi:MAG: hypothetical protein U5K37_05505 [Natrialbaceae archaeon]|nr:hypothetical protein [Natrialbaceae archaeon]
MDECPRCQSPLERLTMGDITTVTCSRCGYADVPVTHESEREREESWQDAIRRFYDKFS